MCHYLVPKNVTNAITRKAKREDGFSLIELFIVVLIIMVIAAVSIPHYQRARLAAENGSALSLMRTIASTETTFYSVRGRYARLDELGSTGTALGTVVGPRIVRGAFTYEMAPLVPTDDEIKNEYSIAGIRTVGMNVQYEVTQSGRIVQAVPLGNPDLP